MLKEENKIFKNLYNNFGWELEKAMRAMIGKILKILFLKERNGLLMKLKLQSLEEGVALVFQQE